MRRDAVSRFLILNHEILPTEKTDIFDRIENAAVYEVVKVVKGIPLFFEEHMERMRNSGDASGIAMEKEDREILDEISPWWNGISARRRMPSSFAPTWGGKRSS